MTIRAAEAVDLLAVWNIFSAVIQTGDTYTFSPQTPEAEFRAYWFADTVNTFVAEDAGEVIGSYIIKPNQPGLGDHIANCSYMVDPEKQGRGTGRQLCEHSIDFARRSGYLGIQFNIVVSSNVGAVKLWKNCGFRIIGTTPNGFRHAQRGLVDTYIMFREL
ncbi:hypothetical protein LEM8419_02619 [Neolewinella maritima]|uniref:N-acetyltransferase domain-containing protein n=1 Tax=Neolewinella maritima TaxID=1383882 RepID=A0ABN8F430_9BACT|nr:GNAT family N-acetyltransferase [Neolewinella maritima]CAH1001713.1 hypothetical protein LEM8419_02619 [Neolewinella maritima]